MNGLSEAEASISRTYPIRRGYLDELIKEFEETISCKWDKLPDQSDTGLVDFEELLRSHSLSAQVSSLVGTLVSLLAILRAAKQLPSRYLSGHNLHTHLAALASDLDSGQQILNIEATALLLAKVISRATDDEIWNAAYNLFGPKTPPTTQRFTTSGVTDTPISASSGAVYNTDEGRRGMDGVIRREMTDHIYLDLPDFFTTFFDSIDGLQSLAKAVFTKCRRTASYNQAKGWRSFPESCKETDVAAWFNEEVKRVVEFALEETKNSAQAVMLASRYVVSTPHLPLTGSTAPRKLDIGFATVRERDQVKSTRAGNRDIPQCAWRDILVPGELKRDKAKDSDFSTWCDLGRYVREVYATQDTRRFSHGFTLCGDVMRVWRFDRGAVYAGPSFNVNQDGQRFVTVLLGYLLMSDEELGYDPTISKDGNQRHISVVRDGTEQRFLIDYTMHRQCSIFGRGTTCWRATLEDSHENFVVKDSWQYEGKEDEGELLTESTRAGVRNVASCYHSETVRIGQMDDDLHGSIRKEIDVSNGRKWKPRQQKLRQQYLTTTSGKSASSSSVHKRMASTSLHEDRFQKRSRSNTEGESGSGGTQNCSTLNRLHKRIIMSRYGKPLYLTRTRLGLLKGLMDGISGHQHLFLEKKILHRDISIGNVLISEDETEGFLIDLDHAIRVNRTENSGARGRTGTKVFMSIGLLLQGDSLNPKPHSFMDDLESMFWLLFWICVHYSGSGGKGSQKSTRYEEWNFRSPEILGSDKAGTVGKEQDFLDRITADFTDYFAPLVPWVNRLRHEVFPGGFRWTREDPTLYDRMRDVLQQAMQDPIMVAEWSDDAKAR